MQSTLNSLPYPKYRVIKYNLSDTAYNHLLDLARQANYIYSTDLVKSKPKGISEFLNIISEFTYQDSRPSYIKQSDLQRLQNQRLPYWSLEYQRRARWFKLTDAARQAYVCIAMQFGITNNYYYKTQRLSTTSLVNATLEAIGIEWLTPTQPADPSAQLYVQREHHPLYKPYFFDW